MSDRWLAEANRNILIQVRDADDGQLEWEFFCECGHVTCFSRVHLTLDAYIELCESGGHVLATGHRVSQLERARGLRENAEALRAQAKHQVQRAKKNLG